MGQVNERELARLARAGLGGDERAALEDRLAGDPDARRSFVAFEAVWSDLDLPEPAAAPAGFAARVLARARERGDRELRWQAAPGWVKAAATVALLGGLALGAAAGRDGADLPDLAGDLTLAEEYWIALEEMAPGGHPSGDNGS